MITQPGEQPCLSSLCREPPTNQDLSAALHRAHGVGVGGQGWQLLGKIGSKVEGKATGFISQKR